VNSRNLLGFAATSRQPVAGSEGQAVGSSQQRLMGTAESNGKKQLMGKAKGQ